MRELLLPTMALIFSVACSARGGGGDLPPPADVPTAKDIVSTIDVPPAVDIPPPLDVPPIVDAPQPIDACCQQDVARDACTPTGIENTNAACSNGIDDDCDGFIDCGLSGTLPDFDCTRTVTVTVCPHDSGVPVDTGCVPTGTENTNAACTDGRDNDCDGFIDCGLSGTLPDFDCTRTPSVTVCPADAGAPRDTSGCIASGRESGFSACNDGLDNDCNGFADCTDRTCSCTGSCGPNRAGCTCRGAENTNAACSNGIDDDCDGFIDCGASGTSPDFDCTMSTSVTVCPRDAG